ncbi:hypothetical protein H4S02_011142, partial [Coemansia sp. RSA 2611]
CDCMDLYYDHIMFDAKHHEMAQLEAEKATQAPRRASRFNGRKRSSLLVRKQKSEPAMEPNQRSLVYNTAGY